MDGLTELRKIQLGRERKNGGDAGTAVAATAVWRGQGLGEDQTVKKRPNENVGLFLPTTRQYTAYNLAGCKLGSDPATFEQLPYVLAAAIRGIEKGTRDGAGSGYVYTYDLPKDPAAVELTAITIAFAMATKKITDSGNGLAFVKTGDLIQVDGSTSNDGIYTVATGGVAAEVVVTEALVDEPVGDSVTVTVLTQTYTIEAGNNHQAYETAYGYCASFELAGKGGADIDVVTLASSWAGRQWSKTTFTPALALPSVSELLFGRAKLYIDAIGGTMGTTEKPGVMQDYGLKCTSGLRHGFGGTGNLYFNKAQRVVSPSLQLTLGMLYDDVAVAEVDAWEADTPRKIQIKIEGPTLSVAGTTYSKKTVLLNLIGSWSKFSGLEGAQLGDLVRGTFDCGWDTTAAAGPSIVVVNELAALP